MSNLQTLPAGIRQLAGGSINHTGTGAEVTVATIACPTLTAGQVIFISVTRTRTSGIGNVDAKIGDITINESGSVSGLIAFVSKKNTSCDYRSIKESTVVTGTFALNAWSAGGNILLKANATLNDVINFNYVVNIIG